MKQIFQSLKTGNINIVEVPGSSPRPGDLLIRTQRSLISPGTERMLVDFGKAGWIERVRKEPDGAHAEIVRVPRNPGHCGWALLQQSR